MSMSDCQYCWDTPCTCGADFADYTVEALNRRIAMLNRVKYIKLTNPELCKDIKKFLAEMERLERIPSSTT